jgi:acylglycerol lipase
MRGLTGPTTTVLSDIHEFVLHVSSMNTSSLPIFLMGHSMGGAQALTYLITNQKFSTPRPRLAGLILESPYIALHPTAEPYKLTVVAGTLAARFLPNMQMVQKLPAKHISRSTKVQEDWMNDELCHDTGTLAGLSGMLQRAADLTTLGNGKAVEGLGKQVPCPIWVGHGTEDHVTWYDASKMVFDVLDVEKGDKTFQTYNGAYHKLHAEPEGVSEAFVKDVGEWITQRAKGKKLHANL